MHRLGNAVRSVSRRIADSAMRSEVFRGGLQTRQCGQKCFEADCRLGNAVRSVSRQIADSAMRSEVFRGGLQTRQCGQKCFEADYRLGNAVRSVSRRITDSAMRSEVFQGGRAESVIRVLRWMCRFGNAVSVSRRIH